MRECYKRHGCCEICYVYMESNMTTIFNGKRLWKCCECIYTELLELSSWDCQGDVSIPLGKNKTGYAIAAIVNS